MPGAGAGFGPGDGGGSGGGGAGVGAASGCGSCANRAAGRGERRAPLKATPAAIIARIRAAGRAFIAISYFKGLALMLTLFSLEYILKSISSQSTLSLMVAVWRAISRAKASNEGFFWSPTWPLAAMKFS